jgi:prolycopene isomerase
MAKEFDAVIIGSGIGGLTCGAFLARAGMRVCVLERHSKIGGYAHSFKRGNFRFESGIHSVPLAADGFVFHLLRLLNVDSEVTVAPHESMYSFSNGKETFNVPARLDDIIAGFSAEFPSQRSNVRALIDDMRAFYDALIVPLFHYEERFVEKDTAFIARYFNRSYREHLERFITDGRLVRILGSQWPFCGMPPELAPTIYCTLAFYVHALEGSHQVVGGCSKLADALALAITRRGGLVRTGVEVTGLDIGNNVVRAVTTGNGESIEADVVVSNISPYELHHRIVPEPARNKMWQRRLRGLTPSVSAIGVYCGLRNTVPTKGGSSLDFWFASPEYERIYQTIGNIKSQGPEHLVFLQSDLPGESPTMLLLAFCRNGDSIDWKNDKHHYAEKLLATAERVIPGLRDAIEVMEIGTPSTFERYTANTAGALYGFEATKEVYGEAKVPNITYLSNLYQAGHWCKPGGGVWNVMECGYTASKIILNRPGSA